MNYSRALRPRRRRPGEKKREVRFLLKRHFIVLKFGSVPRSVMRNFDATHKEDSIGLADIGHVNLFELPAARVGKVYLQRYQCFPINLGNERP